MSHPLRLVFGPCLFLVITGGTTHVPALAGGEAPSLAPVRELPLDVAGPHRFHAHRFGPDGQLYLLHTEHALHVWELLMHFLPEMLLLLWLPLTIWAGWRVWQAVRGFRRTYGEPRCPQCDYQLTLLRSRHCPECGASLDEAPPAISRTTVKRRVAGWTSLVLVTLLVVLSYISVYWRYGPPRYWLEWRSPQLALFVVRHDIELDALRHAIVPTSVLSRLDPMTDTHPTRLAALPRTYANWFYFSRHNKQRVYLINQGGAIHAVSLNDGELLWELAGYTQSWNRATNFFLSQDETRVHYLDLDGELWTAETAQLRPNRHAAWSSRTIGLDLSLPPHQHGWLPPDQRAWVYLDEIGGRETLVAENNRRRFRYFDPNTGEMLRTFSFAHGELGVLDVAEDQPERLYALTRDQSTPPSTRIEVWDAAEAALLEMIAPPTGHQPYWLSLSADGRWLYLLTNVDNTVQIDVRDQQAERWHNTLTFPDHAQISACEADATGETVVSVGWRRDTYQWRLLVHRTPAPEP